MRGIDVSRWQAEINWDKVKASGIEFAIIKAGGSDSGFYTDRYFERNYAEAKRVGIAVGAYYFVGKGCVSAIDGEADARRFLDIVKGKQFEMPLYMDNEAQPTSAKAGITEAAKAFCKVLEDSGYYAGLYGSTISGFKERVDDSQLQNYTHWVAQYASQCTYKGKIGIWQYSSEGIVDGINGNVDMDICYVDFPSAIKKNGLNGFEKLPSADWIVKPVKEKTIEERVAELERRVAELERR